MADETGKIVIKPIKEDRAVCLYPIHKFMCGVTLNQYVLIWAGKLRVYGGCLGFEER